MNIEDNLEKVKLIDTYGNLLTTKQLSIMKDYYFDNLTLAEIGDNYGISRQAVNDCITKSLSALHEFEGKLQVCHKSEKLLIELNDLLNLETDDKVRKKIIDIIEIIRS